jgi:hypothetical protein
MSKATSRASTAPRSRSARRARTIITAAAVLGIIAQAAPSQAYVINGPNCRYDPKNDDDGLGIGFSSTNQRADQKGSTEDAAARWNAKMAPQFTLVAYGSSTRDLRVEFANLPVGTYAVTTTWCGSGHYSQDPLFTWNTNSAFYANTGPHRTSIGIHEIGHSYGVAHNGMGGCNGANAGLMFPDPVGKNDACGWIDPTTDDVNGAVDAHNG